MEKKNKVDYKKFIFVEGDDDFHFMCNLLEIEGIKDIYIEKIEGKKKLKQALRAFSLSPAYEDAESINIIVDADASFSGTEDSVKNILRELNMPQPPSHNSTASNEKLKTSFFVMPGDSSNGAIEDLILRHASPRGVFSYVDNLFNNIKTNEKSIKQTDSNYNYPQNDKKAKVQVYLSCNHDSDSRIGISLKNKTIDTSDNCFDEIKSFIANI